MSAWIRRRNSIVGIQLFSSFNPHADSVALLQFGPTRIWIDHELSVDQLTMIFEKPVDAIRLSSFFISGQRKNDVAIRHKPLAPQPDKTLNHRGIAIFHILSAAPIKVAVLLNKLKRIGSPIRALGLNHIDMPYQQNSLHC